MVKGIGETSLGTLWSQGHQLRLQVMLRSTSSGNLQEGRIRGDPVSMTSQWSISKKQNLLHQTLPNPLLHFRTRNCLAWLSKNMSGNCRVKACQLFSIPQVETCSCLHHCMAFLHMNLDHRSKIYLDNLHGCQFSPCDTILHMQLMRYRWSMHLMQGLEFWRYKSLILFPVMLDCFIDGFVWICLIRMCVEISWNPVPTLRFRD